MVCAPPGATTVKRRMATVQRNGRCRRGAGAGAGRGRRSHAALEDANLDFSWADDAQKFHIGLMRKIRMNADFRADLPPGRSGDSELRVVHHDDKMRIAGGDFDALDFKLIGRVTVRRTKEGTPIPAVTSTVNSAIGFQRIDFADARSSVGLDAEFVARLQAAFTRHPCRHAARAVAADLGDGAVGVMQADAAGLRSGPGEELDAISADACVPRAKTPRQFSPLVVCRSLFRHNQEVVAAGVRFGKGNQSSSGLSSCQNSFRNLVYFLDRCYHRQACTALILLRQIKRPVKRP